MITEEKEIKSDLGGRCLNCRTGGCHNKREGGESNAKMIGRLMLVNEEVCCFVQSTRAQDVEDTDIFCTLVESST